MAAPQSWPTGVKIAPMQTGRIDYYDGSGPQMNQMNVTLTSFVCNGATPVTVAATSVTATSMIAFTLKTVGGTVGAIPAIQTITPGTGFTVQGTASDTSTYNIVIIG